MKPRPLLSHLVLIALGLSASSIVYAGQMVARVVQASAPEMSQVFSNVPIKSCQLEQVPVYSSRSVHVPASDLEKLSGMVIGGAIGNHLGGGTGKDVATFLGAVLGSKAVKGRSEKVKVRTGYRSQEVCKMVSQQRVSQRITGYKTYVEFGNQVWELNTPVAYAANDFIKVNVNVSAINY